VGALSSDLDPERPDLILEQAFEESHAGRSAEAARLFEKIANAHTEGKGRAIFFVMASREYVKLEEYEKALEDSKWAVTINPHSHLVWRQLGHILKDIAQYREAEEALTKSIELKPTKVSYIYLGSVLVDLGRLSEAENSFRKAIELEPEFDEAHFNLGCVLRDQERLDEAAHAFKRAVRLSPDYAEAYGALGEVCLWQGKTEESSQYLRRCLELDPDDARAKELLRSIDKKNGDET
jgi:tetratricopeptide (TPR) repeat protein